MFQDSVVIHLRGPTCDALQMIGAFPAARPASSHSDCRCLDSYPGLLRYGRRFSVFSVWPISRTPLISRLAPANVAVMHVHSPLTFTLCRAPRFLVFSVPPISRTPLISRLAPADVCCDAYVILL